MVLFRQDVSTHTHARVPNGTTTELSVSVCVCTKFNLLSFSSRSVRTIHAMRRRLRRPEQIKSTTENSEKYIYFAFIRSLVKWKCSNSHLRAPNNRFTHVPVHMFELQSKSMKFNSLTFSVRFDGDRHRKNCFNASTFDCASRRYVKNIFFKQLWKTNWKKKRRVVYRMRRCFCFTLMCLNLECCVYSFAVLLAQCKHWRMPMPLDTHALTVHRTRNSRGEERSVRAVAL